MKSYLQELQRRNVFRAIAAYVVVGWVLLQVSTTLEEALALPAWFDAVVTALLVIGFPVIVVFSWVYELTPEGLQKTESVDAETSVAAHTGRRLDYITAAGVLILLGIVIADRVLTGPGGEASSPESSPQAVAATGPGGAAALDRSIAVLPFVPMTSSRDDEFFADGLSEEILNVLANIEGLKVAGRTSSFYYKGRNEDLREIAESLGVAHILEGSVRRSGDRLRVTAQLIKADDGFHLWSENFDRSDGDTFAIQDEIATNVARALKTEILGEVSQEEPAERNIEAQNLYLIAQAAIAERTLPETRRARDLYAQASVLDPDNARYLAGYAQAVALQYWNFRDISSEEAIREASDAMQAALGLGQPGADTLAIAGLVEELRALSQNDSEAKSRALDYYERAVRRDPNNILALQWLASIYLDINEPEKSLANFRKVVELDPLNTLSLTGLANALAALGRYDEARSHLFKLQALFPEVTTVYRYLGQIEYQTGRMDKSIFWITRAVELDPSPLEIVPLIRGYTALGWADEALDAAERYRQTSDGIDVSRQVQARLDGDFDTIAEESRAIYARTGESNFAIDAAWADAKAGRCSEAIPVLDRQYPSLQGEVLEYLDRGDLMNGVLLAYCHTMTDNRDDGDRIARLLIDSELLSESVLGYSPFLRLTRVAALGVAGDVAGAIAELERVDPETMPLAVGRLSLTLDEIPVFAPLYDEPVFQQYAREERYEIARQARLLAAGETEGEIVSEVDAAGFELSDI